MTTASEVDDKNPTPYVFVSGDAEQEHQDEINRFRQQGLSRDQHEPEFRVGFLRQIRGGADGPRNLRAALVRAHTAIAEES